MINCSMRLGKIVKSNSHCDYVVQLDEKHDLLNPPEPDDYGFGCFVKLEDLGDRHWAVGLVYNSQLFNPQFLNTGPRLSNDPDPFFTPDLIVETRVLLGTILIGEFIQVGDRLHGAQGIPRVVVPVNTPVFKMSPEEIYQFHLNAQGRPHLGYYAHVLRSGGMFASQLVQQVIGELIDQNLFSEADRRALDILRKELAWKNTLGSIKH
nr:MULTISPECIES: hypothetical protein [unclassified Roseofilum]